MAMEMTGHRHPIKHSILLQFPEGLKKDALRYVKAYEKKGYRVYVSSEPSYGGCDIPIHDAKVLGCKKIVHFGHTKFCDIDEKGIEIEYVPVYLEDVDVEGIMRKAVMALDKYKHVGIVTNISHARLVGRIKKVLIEHGKVPLTAKGSRRCPCEAQILGCDITALEKISKRVDCIIYFGGGTFHALAPGALDENYSLPTLWVDPFSRKVEWITEKIQKVQRQRRVALAKALNANVYGILVSTKVGQYNLPLAVKAKECIERQGKKALIVVGNTFDFTTISNFSGIEAFLNTACPRIVDDQNKLSVPIVNAIEFLKFFTK
ncbi:MAG: diphthamide biosynthesis enzyme Dph2 [Candidatus Micrarchaeia archaeon]